jgi:hypothetical protein
LISELIVAILGDGREKGKRRERPGIMDVKALSSKEDALPGKSHATHRKWCGHTDNHSQTYATRSETAQTRDCCRTANAQSSTVIVATPVPCSAANRST